MKIDLKKLKMHHWFEDEEGYPEYSDEWKKANTVCNWCKEENYESRRKNK